MRLMSMPYVLLMCFTVLLCFKGLVDAHPQQQNPAVNVTRCQNDTVCERDLFCHPESQTCQARTRAYAPCILSNECEVGYECQPALNRTQANPDVKQCRLAGGSDTDEAVAQASMVIVIVIVISVIVALCCIFGLIAYLITGTCGCGTCCLATCCLCC